jgi:hypothetical protein
MEDYKRTPTSRYRGRARDDVLQDVERASEDWPHDVQKTIDEDPAQLELALLVSKAPNVRTLSMRAGEGHIDIVEKRWVL